VAPKAAVSDDEEIEILDDSDGDQSATKKFKAFKAFSAKGDGDDYDERIPVKPLVQPPASALPSLAKLAADDDSDDDSYPGPKAAAKSSMMKSLLSRAGGPVDDSDDDDDTGTDNARGGKVKPMVRGAMASLFGAAKAATASLDDDSDDCLPARPKAAPKSRTGVSKGGDSDTSETDLGLSKWKAANAMRPIKRSGSDSSD